MNRPRIAVLISLSGAGGVERMVINLLHEFAHYPVDIDLLTIKQASDHFAALPDSIRHRPLKARHSLTAIPEIAHYLSEVKPDAMLVAKDRAARAALKARRRARVSTRIVVRLGTNLSTALAGKNALQKWLRLAPIRRLYPLADAIVAVSQGVADDTRQISGVSADRLHVVRNPVITDNLREQARLAAPHEWLKDEQHPVIMGAGRLTRQKDFPTLIQAFARLRWHIDARLMILGDGKNRGELQQLIDTLGISDHVALPGFQNNLYTWLSRADLFVLSSRWEGSPNVLTEAMALGVPVVATDCPSGPNEVLSDSDTGILVAVGDAETMADAMLQTLRAPPDPERLQKAVAEYNAETSAAAYLHLLLEEVPARAD